jgi:hypothetical protein
VLHKAKCNIPKFSKIKEYVLKFADGPFKDSIERIGTLGVKVTNSKNMEGGTNFKNSRKIGKDLIAKF